MLTAAEQPTPKRRLALSIVFWTLFVLATLLLMFDPDREPSIYDQLPLWQRLLVSPLMLPVQWFTLLSLRERLASLLRRVPLPAFGLYLVLGLFLATVLGNNFAIGFGLDGKDLHPDPLINTVLYFGPYGGILIALHMMRRFYAFSYPQVFWMTGLLGALTEQNFLVPLMLLSGNLLGACLLLFNVIPAYAVAFSSIWAIMPQERLPQGARRLGVGGVLLFLVLAVVLFYACAIVWYGLLDLIFGTAFLEL